jgi:thiamine-phosphate pyrophosphorylase
MKLSLTGKNPLYLITDRILTGLNHVEIIKQAVSAGIRIIQIREKEMSKKDLYKEVFSIRNFMMKQRATLVINDYVDIALAVDADGVHLGQDDLPIGEARQLLGKRRIIGISTHNLKQALDAQNAGADYIGFGPVFKTVTKNSGKPRGINMLSEIKKHIQIPVIAIGGITPDTISSVLRSGADAAAVASALLSGDITNNIKRFFNALQ